MANTPTARFYQDNPDGTRTLKSSSFKPFTIDDSEDPFRVPTASQSEMSAERERRRREMEEERRRREQEEKEALMTLMRAFQSGVPAPSPLKAAFDKRG